MEYRGMKLRHELKYYISYPEYYNLVSRLSVSMRRDEHAAATNGYFIRSLYFDDMYNSAYYDKEAGVMERSKYRIRIYNNSPKQIKLEKKTKIDSYISKTSASISLDEFYNIINGDGSFLLYGDKPVMRDYYVAMRTKLLKPSVIVDYDRDVFICDEGNVRITFDKNLRAGVNSFDVFDPDLITVPAMDQRELIMEVKYDNFLPDHIRKLIQTSASRYMAISKYILCRKAKDLTQRKEVLT